MDDLACARLLDGPHEGDGRIGRRRGDLRGHDGSVRVHGDHVGERPTGVDADAGRHAWTSSKICSGEIGMRSIGTPSASETALAIAAATGIVPASPTPLTPSTLLGDGVSVWNSA